MVDRCEALESIPIRPCLAELFQTCVHPPSLPLRVEKVAVHIHDADGFEKLSDNEMSSEDDGKKVYNLFLSDGVLLVQALLEHHLLSLITPEHLDVGDIVVLNKFRVRRANRISGVGEVVFLAVADCDIPLSKPLAEQTATRKRPASALLQDDDGQDVISSPKKQNLQPSPTDSSAAAAAAAAAAAVAAAAAQANLPRQQPAKLSNPPTKGDSDSDSDDFETTSFNPAHVNTRRKTRHEITVNQPLEAPRINPPPNRVRAPDAPPNHTLLSLLHPSTPLPPKNYPCTIFAVISWTSPSILHPRGGVHSPFPPKRHIKIHDPSISARHAGVTVAVYCDAQQFKPRVGTVAVLRGVVMQRISMAKDEGGEVVLNAYERLMREAGVGGRMGRWFEDDEAVLRREGWDVSGLTGWWEGRVRGGRETPAKR